MIELPSWHDAWEDAFSLTDLAIMQAALVAYSARMDTRALREGSETELGKELAREAAQCRILAKACGLAVERKAGK